MRDRQGSRSGAVQWPHSHSFAFSIFDDTDWTTLDNGPIVYDFLTELGFRVTKSVWPLGARAARTTGGDTCAEPGYVDWVKRLQHEGHEVGFHNATDHSSFRSETIEGLEKFKELFGEYPRVGADHAGNSESLYSGSKRLGGVSSAAYAALERALQPERPSFSGSQPNSEYFWGDYCRDLITYWRGFSFTETNTLKSCPQMPYHDPTRPFVNYFFAATDGPRLASFVSRLRPDSLDKLEHERGVCIMYTHLGLDFVRDGTLHPEFVDVMTDLSRRNGWFAPVGDILDHLRHHNGRSELSTWGRNRLEFRWVLDKVKTSRRFGPSLATQKSRSAF